MAKLVQELNAAKAVCGHSPSHVQEDIEVRNLQEFGSHTVGRLGSLAAQHPAIAPHLELLFSQADLPLPASPVASKASSTVSSARSSVTPLSGRLVTTSHHTAV